MSSSSKPREINGAMRRLRVRDRSRTKVPFELLQALSACLAAQGVDVERALPELALALDEQTGSRHPAEAYCQMLYRAAEILDDPLFGLHLGQSMSPADLGSFGYALMSCASLGEALMKLQRYHRLVNDVTPMVHSIVGDTLALRWGIAHGRMGALYDESGLVAFIECGRRLSGLHLVPRAVGFVNPPPEDPSPYTGYFGCPVAWSQPETSLVISLKSLQLPLARPDHRLLRLMEHQADQALSALSDTAEDTATAVSAVVTNLARFGVPGLEQVASELKMSPKILYRRLAAQGQGFRSLRDEALRQLAERLLARPTANLAEVARQLGYAEPSAFVRAFKRWTGVTPMAWREQGGVQPGREGP